RGVHRQYGSPHQPMASASWAALQPGLRRGIHGDRGCTAPSQLSGGLWGWRIILNREGYKMKTRIRVAAPLIAVTLAAAGGAFGQYAGKEPDQLGKVEFANSCSPAVQEKLLRGVAMLHSFYYSAAERAFGEVAAEDNSCAIAAWGFASILMSNPLQGIGAPPKNAPRAQAAIDKGRQMGAKTERERDYLEAVAAYYEDFANRPERARQLARAKAYEALAAKYPGDDDALHALDYMTYAYLQLGLDGEARKTLDEARTLTEINPARATAPYALAAMPARYAVERGAWGDAVKLAPSPSRYPFTEAMTHF